MYTPCCLPPDRPPAAAPVTHACHCPCARTPAVQGGKWMGMQNTYGAVWEASRLPPPPLDIILKDQTGQQVVLPSILTATDVTGDIASTAQFAGSASGGN